MTLSQEADAQVLGLNESLMSQRLLGITDFQAEGLKSTQTQSCE